MAIVPTFGPLAPYIGAPEGVALIDDRKKFWSSVDRRGIYFIEPIKETKDKFCKFLVEQKGERKVLMKDFRGMYLSRIHREGIQYIEPAKREPDICCEFEVFTKDGKVVFRADNGLFLSVVDRKQPNIEAIKEGVDVYCEFTPTIGDIVSPIFEIIKVDFSQTPDLSEKPSTVKEATYVNKSNVEQKHIFTLSWSETTSETTTWTHAWGLNSSVSFDCLLAKTQVSISYSGKYGTSSTVDKTITLGEQTEVTIPPNTKITAKSMVKKDDNCSLPFVAIIKKTRPDGQQVILSEQGTWRGVFYENEHLVIEEEKL